MMRSQEDHILLDSLPLRCVGCGLRGCWDFQLDLDERKALLVQRIREVEKAHRFFGFGPVLRSFAFVELRFVRDQNQSGQQMDHLTFVSRKSTCLERLEPQLSAS